MRSCEHRRVGQAAAGGALVDLGGECAEQRCVLSYGDVVALSGDYFTPEDLFRLAAIPGRQGTECGTRDEIICALKVMAVDEAFGDDRFDPAGEFGHFRFTATAASTGVERRVRDRHLALATANGDHFVAPDPAGDAHHQDSPDDRQRYSRFDSAVIAYRRLHEVALDEAYRLGQHRGDQTRAMAREAAAQHYLTDAFAAGHLRTPVTAIRRFWHHRYPRFWPGLQRKVATDTAAALRELARPVRMLPDGYLHQRTLAAVQARTRGFPPITFGDLLARVFHDWDDDHGLLLDGGGVLFGDGHLEEGVGQRLAVAAARAGIDDVEIAYRLGVAGNPLSGETLYQAVRCATGAPHDRFRSQMWIPSPSADNPAQNWWAPDVESLWNSPIVGTTGMTVGMAVEETLHPGGEVARRLDRLGPGVFEFPGLLGLPALRRWAARKASAAYHHGFLRGLAQDPKAIMLAITANEPAWSTDTTRDGSAAHVLPAAVRCESRRLGAMVSEESCLLDGLAAPLPGGFPSMIAVGAGGTGAGLAGGEPFDDSGREPVVALDLEARGAHEW